MVVIKKVSPKAIATVDVQEMTTTVDFSNNLSKGDVGEIEFRLDVDGKIAFSVSCGSCTKVDHIYKDNKVIGGNVRFTPNSRGLHRKAVYIYQNRKLIERIIIKAQT